MTATYASLRSVTPGITLTAASGGSLAGSGTLFIRVQGKNRYGRNIGSTIASVSYTAGQKIQVTIGSAARATGEDIVEYVVSAAASNSAAAMRRVASWYARDPLTVGGIDYLGLGSDRTLPHTIELTQPSHIALSIVVANLAALPTGSNLIHGMVRQVTTGNGGTIPDASYLRYDSEAIAGDYAAAVGYWILSAAWEWQTNQTSTTAEYGCDRPLPDTDASLVLPSPPYAADGSDGEPIPFWLSNGLSADGAAVISAGTRIAAKLFNSGQDITEIMSRLVEVRLDGYVDRATGVLNTAIAGVGVWNALAVEDVDTSLVRLGGVALPVDLDRGSAAAYSVRVKFLSSQIVDAFGQVLSSGDSLQLRIYFEGLRGTPSALWDVTGDCAIKSGGNMRILPTATGITTAGGRAIIKGFSFPTVNPQTVLTLAADTAGQAIAISGALAGACRVGTPNATEAQRALVGTAAGTQTPSAYTSNVTIGAGQVINVTLSYPTTIRSDYPDAIAGTTAAFNVPSVRVYVRRVGTGQIYLCSATITPPGNTLTISALDGSPVSLPGASAAAFGLFGYNSITAVASSGASSLPADSYQVAIAYHYPSPNTAATVISHAVSDGCIPELDEIAGAISNSKFWSAASTIAAFRADTTLDGIQFRFITDLLGGHLYYYNPASSETAAAPYIHTHNTLPGRIIAYLPLGEDGKRYEVATQGRQTIPVSAVAISPRIDNGCAALAIEPATTPGRPDIRHLAFSGSVDQFGQFDIDMPKAWDGGAIYFEAVWTGLVAGAGDVVWSLAAIAQSNDDAIDTAFGTAVTVTDTFIVEGDRHITTLSGAMTVAGTPSAGDTVCFQIGRLATNGSDTRAEIANLLGLRLYFTTDKPNDA